MEDFDEYEKCEVTHPGKTLQDIAKVEELAIDSVEFARLMDKNDPLRHLRQEFHYPKIKDLTGVETKINPDEECVYFCGNSLGLCPKKAQHYMDISMNKWAKEGVHGYFNGDDVPWAFCVESFNKDMAKLVGAEPDEIAIMNGLTVNLHLLLISFYRPTSDRYKILCESKTFPSDHYAFESQIRLHGYDPETALVYVEPREGESILRNEDILSTIEEHGNTISVICFSGVQYYTGQFFDIPAITKAGHDKGCFVGFDLAHAVGNVELYLHDWDVDFACWCSYKYLNSSPGGLASIFIHTKHECQNFPKLEGWWGHKLTTRFEMNNNSDPIQGARKYRLSNTPGLLCAPLKASLDVFNKTAMPEIVAKSRLLTGYLEMRIKERFQKNPEHNTVGTVDDIEHIYVDILTPSDANRRGAQLSLSFNVDIARVFEELEKMGVLCDVRKPNVIRVTPAPLYCSFEDVHRFVLYLEKSLNAIFSKAREVI